MTDEQYKRAAHAINLVLRRCELDVPDAAQVLTRLLTTFIIAISVDRDGAMDGVAAFAQDARHAIATQFDRVQAAIAATDG